MNLRTVLRLGRDRWKSILLLVLLATATAAVLVIRQTPQYQAQTTLYVSSHADAGNAASAYQGSLLSQQQASTYAHLIVSKRVLSAAADSLPDRPSTGQLAARVSAAVVPDTSLLTVTAVDSTPAGAQRTANAVANRFVTVLPSLEAPTDGNTPAVVVSVVTDASLPSSPTEPKPARSIGLGALAGLLAGFVLAAARQSLDLSVKSLEQAQQIVDAPALGSVPADPAAGRSPMALNDRAHRGRIDALRKISASLRFIDVENRHTVFAVTSPGAEEGKSTTACNLALTLARAGRSVVLVDADLRRPRVGDYLGLTTGVGLTSVLVGRTPLAQATQTWGDRLFTVLTSGPIPPNPTEMLGSTRMRELLVELRERYDDVIVDVAPVLPVADAAVTVSGCDGVLVVARYGRTRRDHLRQAAATLRTTGAPILGVVLNQAPSRRKQQYYDAQPGTPGKRYPGHGQDLTPALEAAHR
ncbi:MAG TPA: polysaccharide biosynthesis tyrosine autokinase [Rugosimonospora sp.]